MSVGIAKKNKKERSKTLLLLRKATTLLTVCFLSFERHSLHQPFICRRSYVRLSVNPTPSVRRKQRFALVVCVK
ncbi:hypothetical protein AB3S75_041780 [Citrus x aurantiifolia]